MNAGRWRSPEHYVHGGGEVVVVPARVAAWLLKYAHLDELRSQVRGADPEVDNALVALAVSGKYWLASATGSPRAPTAEVVAPSMLMSTSQAADSLGITARAVRLAIGEERLPAERVDGRWLITRDEVEHYRAGRQAA